MAVNDAKYVLKGKQGLYVGAQGASLSSLIKFGPFFGTATTRAAVRAQVGDTPAVGSLYFGQGATATTKPNLYVKMASANADTDWERVVTQAAD